MLEHCVYEGDAVEVLPFTDSLGATVYFIFSRIRLGAASRAKLRQVRAVGEVHSVCSFHFGDEDLTIDTTSARIGNEVEQRTPVTRTVGLYLAFQALSKRISLICRNSCEPVLPIPGERNRGADTCDHAQKPSKGSAHVQKISERRRKRTLRS